MSTGSSIEAQPFMFKKTLKGQRAYKKSIPRFVAVSENGICIKWNADITYHDFHKEAYYKLIQFIEAGLVWNVCVLYRVDERFLSRVRTYFKITYTDEDYLDWFRDRVSARSFLRRWRKLFESLNRQVHDKKILSIKEYADKFETLSIDI